MAAGARRLCDPCTNARIRCCLKPATRNRWRLRFANYASRACAKKSSLRRTTVSLTLPSSELPNKRSSCIRRLWLVRDDRKPTIGHRAEHALFMGTVKLAGALGDRGSATLGAALGTLRYFPFRFRRQLVEKHLRWAFPDKDDAWIRTPARAAYAHL